MLVVTSLALAWILSPELNKTVTSNYTQCIIIIIIRLLGYNMILCVIYKGICSVVTGNNSVCTQ